MKKEYCLWAIHLALLCFGFLKPDLAWAQDWSEQASIAPAGRPNPYGISAANLDSVIEKGKRHALQYPVEQTGLLAPYRPIRNAVDSKKSPARIFGLRSFSDWMAWLGLVPYPKPEAMLGLDIHSPYWIPNAPQSIHHMGLTLINRSMPSGVAQGFTVSCAACHATQLFGRPVLGLTNRFSRANVFFRIGKTGSKVMPVGFFEKFLDADAAEAELLKQLKDRTKSIEVKVPKQLGLDTSLSHVALSLSRRSSDEWASPDRMRQRFPDPDFLRSQMADSKPAPWFNLKYKTKWLLDGSVVSGNPILTNILWNEIGRGADLKVLSSWMDQNPGVIEELTTAVFSTEAPRFTDFFSANRISLNQAKEGEKLFNQSCAKCHGTYIKAWSLPESERIKKSDAEILATLEVKYHSVTPVINVGTDSYRAEGMKSLAARLNPLEISIRNGIRIQPQKGYVPPPLVGIWARWPYFHNNSVPSLCGVLSPHPQRPKTYFAGPAIDQDTDFDVQCNGYPMADRVPKAWKENSELLFDSRQPGLGNQGHDQGILIRNGQEVFSALQKRQIIQFLQTL